MTRAYISAICYCGLRGVVLFHGEFFCGRCADVLLEDSPAHEFLRMDCAIAATALIEAIDAELIR